MNFKVQIMTQNGRKQFHNKTLFTGDPVGKNLKGTRSPT